MTRNQHSVQVGSWTPESGSQGSPTWLLTSFVNNTGQVICYLIMLELDFLRVDISIKCGCISNTETVAGSQ